MSELGQTRDPAALVPGSPGAVRRDAEFLRVRASHAEQAGDGLAEIDAGGWTGRAAEVFRDRFSYEPAKWYAAANSLATAAEALTTYADTLEWAQGRAGEAVRMWDEAEAASREAERFFESTAPAEPFVDPGIGGREAARDMLRLARDQVATAGDVVAGFVGREADTAPERSSWLDGIGDRVRETGADLVNGVASVGNAVLGNPGETAALAGGIALAAASAAAGGLAAGISATGVGAVAGVPLSAVAAAGVVTGAAVTATAAGSLMRHAADEDAVTPVSAGTPTRSVPTKTDRMKEHLTERDLDAARRELNGEVVATKPSGQPWDHVDEVRNAQRGLVRRIGQLTRLLGDSRVPAGERAAYETELSEASRLLDHSEQFVPRIVP